MRRIKKLAAPKVELVVQIATAYAWLTAMMIIALVPIDVWATISKNDTAAIAVLWDVAYW
jgi:hypothetical protein